MLVNRQGTPGARMCRLDQYGVVARRTADRARTPSLRSEGFRTHSVTERRSFDLDAPLDGPSGNEGPPALPTELDRFEGNVTDNFPGNPVEGRRRDRAQLELRELALRGFAGGFLESGKVRPVSLPLAMPLPTLSD